MAEITKHVLDCDDDCEGERGERGIVPSSGEVESEIKKIGHGCEEYEERQGAYAVSRFIALLDG